MKQIIFALSLASLILISSITALVSLGEVIYLLVTSNHVHLFQFFEAFALSSILFLACITSYIVTKTLTNTEVLSDVMAKFLQNEMTKSQPGSMMNPFQALFGQAFNNAKIITIDESQFSSPEEFQKHREQILAKAFGQKPADIRTKLEEMTLEELKAEEKKAVGNQDFELAACIVSLIEEKKKGKK